MKVVAFNGSPNREGNTWHALKMVTVELEQAGIETELIHIGGQPIRGCLACYRCRKEKNSRCSNDQDPVNEWIAKMVAADAINRELAAGVPRDVAAWLGPQKLARAILYAMERQQMQAKRLQLPDKLRRNGKRRRRDAPVRASEHPTFRHRRSNRLCALQAALRVRDLHPRTWPVPTPIHL